jgi:hypothetical protein
MPIPSRQIGWSTQDNLLWQIAKQMEQAECQLCTLNDNIGTITGTAGTSGSSGSSGANGAPGSSGTSGTSGVALYYGSFIFDHATTLTSAMNSNTTNPIQVVDTTGFNAPGYIRIGTEIIAYTGISGNSFTGITRGVASSNASNHSIGDGVAQAQYTPAGVPKQVILDETDLSNGAVLNVLTGDVTIANSGVYNLQFSVQLENFSNNVEDAIIWFTVNGNDVPKSASYITTPTIHGGTPGATLMTVNIFYTITGGDVVGLKWTSKNGRTAITSIPPVGSTIPQSPGVIFTVNKIGI